jgi:hypothetical protein
LPLSGQFRSPTLRQTALLARQTNFHAPHFLLLFCCCFAAVFEPASLATKMPLLAHKRATLRFRASDKVRSPVACG